MKKITEVSAAIDGCEDKLFSIETGRMAPLAGGAVVAKLGRTEILVTATGAKDARDGASFFPLTVDIEERMYAAGKIPGSFFRREGRAGETAILTCRLIDRPLRPNFPDGFRNDVHIVGTVLGADQENPHDVVAINAASAALMLSDVPFDGPIGACRLAYTSEGEWIPFPTYEEGKAATFEIVVAGRLNESDDVAISMVEAGGTEGAAEKYANGAKKVDEAVLAEGLEASKVWIRQMINVQNDLVAKHGAKPKIDFTVFADTTDEILAAVETEALSAISDAMKIADKTERGTAESAIRKDVREKLAERFPENESEIDGAVRTISKRVVRERALNEGLRIDGRGATDIRQLWAEVGVVSTAHGSGLFQRGETQVLNVATLGTARMDQQIDGIDPNDKKRYMHHYNFPPFCTGETGFMRGPKRREIGHGALAERALVPVIPDFEDFPYTYRLVSEVLASNGSSSMASVCGSSLSLMDAGVPIAAPVAGIAMGLIHEGDQYLTITDILGAEDAMGDMDFKVAGTEDFITALQLDTKIDGIPADVLASALNQAREARLAVLATMQSAIEAPRDEVNENAPQIVSFEIPLDKIGEVIGPKGKVINAMQQETGADISVDDDGMVGIVSIAATDRAAVSEAERQIRLILDPPTPEVGVTYTGKVVNITNFGAFVNILPGRDGLVHISKLGGKRRIERVEDEVSLGDEIEVIVEDIDPNGKISLMPAEHADEFASDNDSDETEGKSDQADSSTSSEDSSDRGRSRNRGGRGRNRDGRGNDSDRGERGDRGGRSERGRSRRPKGLDADIEVVSFNEVFDAEQADRYGEI